MTPAGWLTLQDIAERTGLAVDTIRKYVQRGGFPAADDRAGREPLWRVRTVARWEQTATRRAREDKP